VDVGGVSCASSTTACVLVGAYWNNALQMTVPLSEVKTASGWALASVPVPSASLSGFNGISCAAQNACVAVGVQQNGLYQGLYGKWNGSSWTVGDVPAPSGASNLDLLKVSCRTAGSCVAVGFEDTGAGPTAASETWNGSTWTAHSVPVPTGATSPSLRSVSCVSTTACQAVGGYGASSGGALAVFWNGTTWKAESTPLPAGATTGVLYDVSCKASNACTAVGQWYGPSTSGGLIERWNGAHWTVQTGPSTPALWQLTGVSCATTTACTTVATTASSDWTGTSWGPAQSYATPTDGGLAAIDSISCLAAQSCIGAGSSVHLLASQVPLVEGYS
jgi:hypothetical protein